MQAIVKANQGRCKSPNYVKPRCKREHVTDAKNVLIPESLLLILFFNTALSRSGNP